MTAATEPTVRAIHTALGDVDCAVVGHGPPVLVVNGSPGGTMRPGDGPLPGRGRVPAIVPDRPGYFDTPLSSDRTPDQQADLYVALGSSRRSNRRS